MAKLHIVYDPNERISTNSELEKTTGIKVAILSISDDLGDLDIHQTAIKLTELLLAQVRSYR